MRNYISQNLYIYILKTMNVFETCYEGPNQKSIIYRTFSRNLGPFFLNHLPQSILSLCLKITESSRQTVIIPSDTTFILVFMKRFRNTLSFSQTCYVGFVPKAWKLFFKAVCSSILQGHKYYTTLCILIILFTANVLNLKIHRELFGNNIIFE